MEFSGSGTARHVVEELIPVYSFFSQRKTNGITGHEIIAEYLLIYSLIILIDSLTIPHPVLTLMVPKKAIMVSCHSFRIVSFIPGSHLFLLVCSHSDLFQLYADLEPDQLWCAGENGAVIYAVLGLLATTIQ